MPLETLYDDGALAVIEKPANVSLLRDRSGAPCYWDEIVEKFRASGRPRPLLVHRLDKGTSGVLLVATSPGAQASLARQFAAGEIGKCYAAITDGVPEPKAGWFDLPLRPGRKGKFRLAGSRASLRVERAARGGPRWVLQQDEGEAFPSQTQYRVLSIAKGRALVMLRPLTGRTHQLRVHLAWTGTPIVGDHLYGETESASQAGERLMLHCRAIGFQCDWLGGVKRVVVRSPLPGEFRRVID